MTSPAPARARSHLRLVRDDTAPLIQAAAGLARALRSHGLVATETAATSEGARIWVITPHGSRLAERFDVLAPDGIPWLYQDGEPLTPADDPESVVGIIAHVLKRTAGEPGDIPR
jgi:hypothetical protein